MNTAELSLIAVAVIGLILWSRGCHRISAMDCIMGLLIGSFSCAAYFVFLSLTHIEYLAAIIFAGYLVTLLSWPRMRRTRFGQWMMAVCFVLMASAALTEYKLVSAGNAMLIIEPYRTGTTWAFDEPLLHLKREPFVEGIPEIIDKLAGGIPGSDKRVRLLFSQHSFPGAQIRLDWRREQDGGNWYYNDDYKMEGWLCPSLFKFFARAPRHLYVRAESADS